MKVRAFLFKFDGLIPEPVQVKGFRITQYGVVETGRRNLVSRLGKESEMVNLQAVPWFIKRGFSRYLPAESGCSAG
jgi:hypothetical protein